MDLSTHPLWALFGLLLGPALCAGGACLWSARRGRHGALGVLGVVLGYLAGHAWSLGEWPSLPPATSSEALWWTGAIGGLCALVSLRPRRTWMVAALASAGAAALLLRARLGDMGAGELALELGGSALAAGSGVLSLERVAERARGVEAVGLSALVVIATLACVGLTGSFLYAQFGASLAAVLLGAFVAGTPPRGVDVSRALVPMAVVQVLALSLAASHFSSLPSPARLALACAPACLSLIGGAATRWRVAVLAVPLGVALALAWQQHEASMSSSYP
ncbi:MAG: hypothetical protein FJ298_00445 [Planctomycetes bacterium]|nr:hypothetical protein [Planctomycetota bacterium]